MCGRVSGQTCMRACGWGVGVRTGVWSGGRAARQTRLRDRDTHKEYFGP